MKYGDSREEIDDYYIDNYVFRCKRIDDSGLFEVLNVFFDDGSQEAYEEIRRGEISELGNKGKTGYNGSAKLLKNANTQGKDDSNGIGDNGSAEGVSELATGRAPRNSANAKRGNRKNVVYSPDGRLIASLLTQGQISNMLKNVRRQIIAVWHGSGADFEAFSRLFAETGEGVQAYGNGLYFTSIREIAEWYAKKAVRSDSNIYEEHYKDAQLVMADEGYYPDRLFEYAVRIWHDNGKSIDAVKKCFDEERNKNKRDLDEDSKAYSLKGLEKEYEECLKRLENKSLDASEREELERNKNKLEAKIDNVKAYIDDYYTIRFDAIDDIESIFNDYVKDLNDRVGRRHLYKAEFNDDALLEWNTPLTEEQWTRVCDTVRANPLKYFSSKKKAKDFIDNKAFTKDGTLPTPFYLHRAKSLYKDANADNAGDAISKLLHDAGFIGHKFPAASHARGDYSHGTNYVIYDDADVNIIDHLRFQIAEAANAIRYQRAYTGSGARWAAIPGNPLGGFDANFIGTGEGAQAYGWGFYTTSKWGIAKAYAQANSGPS
ncbi:MAG: hypothetical protein LUD39_04690, partial [Opitutae bacterium]|nr:hypothetical protein [Opitutae bacterium]